MSETSYNGPAVLVQNSTEITIDCSYRVMIDRPLGPDGPGGLKSWRGSFSVVSGNLAPGDALLRLPNGSTGDVLVNAVEASSLAGLHGRFVGNGPAP